MGNITSTENVRIAYDPDEVAPPGATLRETLEALPLSQTELATRTGLSAKHINQLVGGQAALSHETAIKLERATGVPAQLWNSLEANYRDHLSRVDERQDLAEAKVWLTRMPVSALRGAGFVTATMRDPGAVLQEVLAFFGVSSIEAWDAAWARPSAAFLQTAAFQADPGAVAAWLRIGELEARRVATEPFDRAKLKMVIPELRRLTVLEPSVFWPEVQRLCAEAGIAVILVPEVTGARAHGATRWLSPSKALVQLSVRHKRNDHFWFALFHELGHVLLHGKKEVFVESKLGEDGGRLEQEQEANSFAANTLIPPDSIQDFEQISTITDANDFANQIGIHPGIVVGRLQRERNDYKFGHSLFARLVVTSS